MAYELQDNSGTLFKNNKKQDGDKLPDYTGNVKINGKELRIAGWVKSGAKGSFLSLKISEHQPSEKFSDNLKTKPVSTNSNSDDLPF